MASTGRGKDPLQSTWASRAPIRKPVVDGSDGVAAKAAWTDWFFGATAGGSTVSPDLLGGATIFSPIVGPPGVQPAVLGGGATFTPVVAPGGVTVSPALLGAGSTFAPTVNQTTAFGVLGASSLFTPTVQPGGVSVSPALLGESSITAPTVQPGGVSVSPDLLGGSVISDPIVLPGGVTVSPALLGGATTSEPTILATTTVSPDILGGAVLSDPVVIGAAGQTVSVPTIQGIAGFDPGAFDPGAFDTSQVFPLTVTVGVAPIAEPAEPAGQLWRPLFAYDPDEQLIHTPTLGRSRLFEPAITQDESEDWVIDPRLMELVLT